MAKEPQQANAAPEGPQKYDQVVERLDEVVKRLEGGKLSLEDSLKAFEEGIRLVRRGEGLLAQAERRIEELLHEDGQDRAAPLESPAARAAGGGSAPREPAREAPREVPDDDVPF